ncbi:hypothetical protein EGK75_03425 [Neisseria weixii]|uniref:Uncharacterized protein n=1 Tax=Neisseria weixii TaxID=1853276 RepID=A0A3N4N5U1_9NEIS|nr:hypothetical protein CGZ65_04585 [Neisseria weixii]RPD89517.1 hypothetical protein EGK74_03425 [Neisseria weixii]RPD89854.1 hypothetical protein EGK75_03425 [Neisseria weixii]
MSLRKRKQKIVLIMLVILSWFMFRPFSGSYENLITIFDNKKLKLNSIIIKIMKLLFQVMVGIQIYWFQ